jgi:hypothetical protein
VAAVQCAAHPDVETERVCVDCKKAICDACAVYEIDGRAACAECGLKAEATSRAIGSALLAVVGVSFLFAVAVGVALFKQRPFVGGVAAVFSILTRYALQAWLRPRAVTARS